MLKVKVSDVEEKFIRDNMFLADEAFCAGSTEDETFLIQRARAELGYPDSTSNDLIRQGLKSSYRKITGLRS